MKHTPPTPRDNWKAAGILYRLTWILALGICFAPLTVHAQPGIWAPGAINYQGQLIQENGTPLPDGAHTLHVTIYNALLNGTAVWGPYSFDGGAGQGHAAQAFVGPNGRFNVVLGELDTQGRRLRDAMQVMEGVALFVELQVDDDPPLKPRQRFLSMPYVIQAAGATQLADVITQGESHGLGKTPTATLDIEGNLRIRGDLDVEDVQLTKLDTTSLKAGPVVVSTGFGITGDLEVHGTLEASGFGPVELVSHSKTFSGFEYGNASDLIPGVNTAEWYCSLTTIDLVGYSGSALYGCEVAQSGGQWRLFANREGTSYNVVCTAQCFKFK